MMAVSVVIITRNRSFILGDCLKALEPEIERNRHEVVVVDSSEDHKTADVVKNFDWVKYHRISLPLGTRPQSYSHGAQLGQGEIIALLDDDAIALPGWLAQLESCFADPRVGVAGGRVLPKEGVPLPKVKGNEAIGVINLAGKFISNLYIDTGHSVEVDVVRGCNMAARKLLLEKMNYFDARFRGQNCRVEDDICLWVKRMGYKVVFEPKAVVRHLAEERPDIPRSEYSARSEFYVWRNTAWLYAKHFGLHPKILFTVSFLTPFRECVRRVMGGSFKKPRITRDGMHYLPAALAGVSGGIWGLLMSCLYRLQDSVTNKRISQPHLISKQLVLFHPKASMVS